uniref:Family with sequence similarity 177 member B n=1 Tax=Acanthochromis polyacanthus TaxID=80966 RepID=A0A3Q1GA45_9TELE
MQRCHQETPGDFWETEFGGPSWSRQKKVIHFSSGETLELEDSEEEEEEDEQPSNKTPFKEPVEKTKFSFRNVVVLVGRISLLACDFLGERLVGALGLNAAKYQYAVDQFHRDQKKQPSPGPDDVRNQERLESIRLSPGLEGSRYGASGDGNRPDDPQRIKGRDNRGYQADYWE